MSVLIALSIGTLLGGGVHLVVAKRPAAGTLLITNAAILLPVSAGFGEGGLPILLLESLAMFADPVVQSLALAAVVMGFATTILLVRITLAVERTSDRPAGRLVQKKAAQEHPPSASS